MDALLTLEECAAWLRITAPTLLKYTKGRFPVVPCIQENRHFIRFHPRTILAKFAADAGLSSTLIAASRGISLGLPQPLAPPAPK